MPAKRSSQPPERPRTGSAADRDNPGVIAPPPLLFAAPLAVGLVLQSVVLDGGMGLPGLFRWPIGSLAILAGLAIIGLAVERFARAGTNPEPWKPATTVVADGIYRLSRNPMYLGMALAYAGIAVLADSALTLALLLPALLIVDFGVIRREEAYLERKFGARYRNFTAQTRRWL
ncbi:methyltransferase family protein [Pacificimonas flava]|nr:isoprenylcysteine carboxylmethyltransferase family protein [Pacificimonas flava]MBB5280839.1 protein-S-isoprenylcysteine O-methyltransferase Ste14 [Pacificimonas flava]